MTGFDFEWPQFLWMVFIFVGVPTIIAAAIIRAAYTFERPRALEAGVSTENTGLGLWATGLVAFPLGFLSCAGWLSWSAGSMGRVLSPNLPAPDKFPSWQIYACGATVVLACFAVAHFSRWVNAGGLAAAAGMTAGFTTAFGVQASTDSTGQSGVGMILSEIGWGVGLGALMLIRGALVTKYRRGRAVESM